MVKDIILNMQYNQPIVSRIKKNLCIILCMGVAPILFSQVYNPIPMDSVYWVELESGYDGGNCTYYSYRYIYSVGSISVKGNIYSEYRANSITTYTNDMPPWLPCQSTQYMSDYLYILIRNDSLNKKVYFYDSNYTHQEKILYDFDIGLGDTVHPESAICACNLQCPYDTFIVNNIDSIDIGGEFRKSFQVIKTNHTDTLYFIEGIGSNLGFAYNIYCPNELSTTLVCFHHKDLSYAPPNYIGSVYCTTTIGVQEAEMNHNFITSYTPDLFYIENGGNNLINIICYDVLGKFILERSFYESGYIDFTEKLTGIYFMYILYNGQMIKPYKIIIQH